MPAGLVSRWGDQAGVRQLRLGNLPESGSVVMVAEMLPGHVEISAYYVVAEALTNAARHARASAVSVEIEVDGEVVRVAVRDDGAGDASFSGGTGLVGLKDRWRPSAAVSTSTARPGQALACASISRSPSPAATSPRASGEHPVGAP